MESRKLLTPSETTERLGISYPSLLRLVKAGKIPVIRIGKSLRFPMAYFERVEAEALESVDINKEDL